MSSRLKRSRPRAAFAPAFLAAASLVLSGCAQFSFRKPGPDSAQIIVGPSVTNNSTLLEKTFACYRSALMAAESASGGGKIDPLSISVGEVRDYTGKSSINEGMYITQGGALMVMSALGHLSPSVRIHERFDPRIAELELIYGDKRQLGDGQMYGVPGNGGMQRVPWTPYFGGTILSSRYFIVGGITEVNWNIQSGGIQAYINQIGPAARVFTANIAADLRIVDTRSLVVLHAVSLQKQVTGHEVDANIFNFYNNRLFDISAGTKSQEPIQLAVRTTLELGVLELLQSVSGVPFAPCLTPAVEAGIVSPDYNPSDILPASPSERPPVLPVPLSSDAMAPQNQAGPRGARTPHPLAMMPRGSQPSGADIRAPVPAFLQPPTGLPAPGSLSLPSGGISGPAQAPAITTPGQTWPDPQGSPRSGDTPAPAPLGSARPEGVAPTSSAKPPVAPLGSADPSGAAPAEGQSGQDSARPITPLGSTQPTAPAGNPPDGSGGAPSGAPATGGTGPITPLGAAEPSTAQPPTTPPAAASKPAQVLGSADDPSRRRHRRHHPASPAGDPGRLARAAPATPSPAGAPAVVLSSAQ